MDYKKIIKYIFVILIAINVLLLVACLAWSYLDDMEEENLMAAISDQEETTAGQESEPEETRLREEETERVPQKAEAETSKLEKLDLRETSWQMADPAVAVNSPKTATLAAILKQYLESTGTDLSQVSIVYENLITHERYVFNGDQRYFTASTVKTPVAMVYYQMIYDGILPQDLKVPYVACEYFIEDGYPLAPQGTNLPVKMLIENAIIHSGNTSTSALFNYFKENGSFLHEHLDKRLGMKYSSDTSITANEAMRILEELYYNEHHVPGYDELKNLMKRTTWHYFFTSKLPGLEIAHKYGLYDANMHDIGIVYADQPYAFAVYTNTGSGYQLIPDIGWIINEWHEKGSVNLAAMPATELPANAASEVSYEEYYENTEYPAGNEMPLEAEQPQLPQESQTTALERPTGIPLETTASPTEDYNVPSPTSTMVFPTKPWEAPIKPPIEP